MGDMTGILFKFTTDSTDNIQLLQNNIDQVKKAVRKMYKKYDVFSQKVVTRQIKLLLAGEEKEMQLRIAPNVDVIYTTSDQTYKGDWEALGHLTVHVEPSHRDFKPEEKNKSGLVGVTLEELHELKSRIDKLENLVNSKSPLQRNIQIKSAAKKAASVVNSLVHPNTPPISSPPISATRALTTTNKSTTSAPSVKTSLTVSKCQTSPKKPVPTPKTAPSKVQVAVSSPAKVNLNADFSSQTTATSQKITPVKPALTKRTAPKSKQEPATAYPVPYNVSRPSKTPQTMVNSTPQTNGVPASTNILKRALNVSGETLGTPIPQKKPRQEPVSDPKALIHLEAIIDSVAAGLENPDDFDVEAPYFVSQMGEAHSAEQEYEQVLEYSEFAESFPKKKKKSKKQRHSQGEGEATLTM